MNSLQAFAETKVTRSSHGKSVLADIQEQWQRDQRQKKCIVIAVFISGVALKISGGQ